MYNEDATPDANLANHGYGRHGAQLNVPKDERSPGDETAHLNYFETSNRSDHEDRSDASDTDLHTIDGLIAREQARVDHLDPVALRERNEAFAVFRKPVHVRDANMVARAQAILDRTAPSERSEEAARHAAHLAERRKAELHHLSKSSRAREALQLQDLSSDPEFGDAVRRCDFHKVHDILVATFRSKSSAALRAACIGGLIHVAPYVDPNYAGNLDDAWLERVTGVARSCCRKLLIAFNAFNKIQRTEALMLLVGTESESSEELQRLARQDPVTLKAAVEAFGQFHTERMIEHAGTCAKTARERKISRRDWRIMTAVDMDNEAGWEQLLRMPPKAAEAWLAGMLNQHEEWATRSGGVVATASSAAEPRATRFVTPSQAEPTERLVTQRRLDANHAAAQKTLREKLAADGKLEAYDEYLKSRRAPSETTGIATQHRFTGRLLTQRQLNADNVREL